MGHIYLALHQQDKAIACYQKSIHAFSNISDFWDAMKDDFQYLEQYGINKEMYEDLLEELKEKYVKDSKDSLE